VTDDELDRELDGRRDTLRVRITVLLDAVEQIQRERAAIDDARWPGGKRPGRRTRHRGWRVIRRRAAKPWRR
jgi:hypothetical protein